MKLSGVVFALQQLEEELERPDVGPMAICTDSRPCTQVTADPGRHRMNLTHGDRDAMKVCEYVRRGRVEVRWIPTDRNWADIFTNTNTTDGGQVLHLLEAGVWIRTMADA
jgi:hypothetical protein